MIAVFTDFGWEGPYLGQMKAAILATAPDQPVIQLMADAPPCQVQLSAYLLAALAPEFPDGTIFLAVVDPGVGSHRPPVILRTDRHIFVGPGNGLFEIVRRRAQRAVLEEVTWRPARLSASFHGRDLFAPVAARLARGEQVAARLAEPDLATGADWPDDLNQVIYVDRFGNAMTGLRASHVGENFVPVVHGQTLRRAESFFEVAPGTPFWYENSSGLVEIAVNKGRADTVFGLKPGNVIDVMAMDGHFDHDERIGSVG